MAWVRLDDSFYSHPKVLAVGPEATGVFVMTLTYSSHHLTDGHVPEALVKQIAGSRARKVTDALLGAGLWEQNGTGYAIHDYHDYQPSRAQVEQQRRGVSEARSAAGKRGAQKRWGKATA